MDKMLHMIVSFKTRSYIKNRKWIQRGQKQGNWESMWVKFHRIGSPSMKDKRYYLGFTKENYDRVLMEGMWGMQECACMHACVYLFVSTLFPPLCLCGGIKPSLSSQVMTKHKAAPGKAHILKDATNQNSKVHVWQRRLFEKFCTQARAMSQ